MNVDQGDISPIPESLNVEVIDSKSLQQNVSLNDKNETKIANNTKEESVNISNLTNGLEIKQSTTPINSVGVAETTLEMESEFFESGEEFEEVDELAGSDDQEINSEEENAKTKEEMEAISVNLESSDSCQSIARCVDQMINTLGVETQGSSTDDLATNSNELPNLLPTDSIKVSKTIDIAIQEKQSDNLQLPHEHDYESISKITKPSVETLIDPVALKVSSSSDTLNATSVNNDIRNDNSSAPENILITDAEKSEDISDRVGSDPASNSSIVDEIPLSGCSKSTSCLIESEQTMDQSKMIIEKKDEILEVTDEISKGEDDILRSEDDILGGEDDILGDEDNSLGDEDKLLGYEDKSLEDKDDTLEVVETAKDEKATNAVGLEKGQEIVSINVVCEDQIKRNDVEMEDVQNVIVCNDEIENDTVKETTDKAEIIEVAMTRKETSADDTNKIDRTDKTDPSIEREKVEMMHDAEANIQETVSNMEIGINNDEMKDANCEKKDVAEAKLRILTSFKTAKNIQGSHNNPDVKNENLDIPTVVPDNENSVKYSSNAIKSKIKGQVSNPGDDFDNDEMEVDISLEELPTKKLPKDISETGSATSVANSDETAANFKANSLNQSNDNALVSEENLGNMSSNNLTTDSGQPGVHDVSDDDDFDLDCAVIEEFVNEDSADDDESDSECMDVEEEGTQIAPDSANKEPSSPSRKTGSNLRIEDDDELDSLVEEFNIAESEDDVNILIKGFKAVDSDEDCFIIDDDEVVIVDDDDDTPKTPSKKKVTGNSTETKSISVAANINPGQSRSVNVTSKDNRQMVSVVENVVGDMRTTVSTNENEMQLNAEYTKLSNDQSSNVTAVEITGNTENEQTKESRSSPDIIFEGIVNTNKETKRKNETVTSNNESSTKKHKNDNSKVVNGVLETITLHVHNNFVADIAEGIWIDLTKNQLEKLKKKHQSVERNNVSVTQTLEKYKGEVQTLMSHQSAFFRKINVNPEIQRRTVSVNVKVFRPEDVDAAYTILDNYITQQHPAAPIIPAVTRPPQNTVQRVPAPLQSQPQRFSQGNVASLRSSPPVVRNIVQRPQQQSNAPVPMPLSVRQNQAQRLPQSIASKPRTGSPQTTTRAPLQNVPKATRSSVFVMPPPNVTIGNRTGHISTMQINSQSRPLLLVNQIPQNRPVVDLTVDDHRSSTNSTSSMPMHVNVPLQTQRSRAPMNSNILVPGNLLNMVSNNNAPGRPALTPVRGAQQMIMITTPQPCNSQTVTTLRPTYAAAPTQRLQTYLVRMPNAPPTSIATNTSQTAPAPVATPAATPAPVPATALLSRTPPFPAIPMYPRDPAKKLIPPKPILRGTNAATGIIISWNMTLTSSHEEISSYHLFAYQEQIGSKVTATDWTMVGEVKALPLPMACTLTQFVEGNNYYFTIRSVDRHDRFSPFSDPVSVVYKRTIK